MNMLIKKSDPQKHLQKPSTSRRKLMFIGFCISLFVWNLGALSYAQPNTWRPPTNVKFGYDIKGNWMGNIYGKGAFTWSYSPQNHDYVMEVSISAFLMTFLYTSKGVYDENTGILPSSYREKRIGRDRTVSFDYPNQTLSYSWKNKSDTRALQAGTQDAISVLMQLIHHMKNNIPNLQSGEKITFPIARMGSVKEWSFSVLGQTSIKVGNQDYPTWHIEWLSPDGEDSTLVEMWLAPQLAYMPVKLYYWSDDGSYLHIDLNKIKAFTN